MLQSTCGRCGGGRCAECAKGGPPQGGIAAKMRIRGTNICFVSSHLAAHQVLPGLVRRENTPACRAPERSIVRRVYPRRPWSTCASHIFSLPFRDWCPLRVYSLSPSAIGACYGYTGGPLALHAHPIRHKRVQNTFPVGFPSHSRLAEAGSSLLGLREGPLDLF